MGWGAIPSGEGKHLQVYVNFLFVYVSEDSRFPQ